MGATLEEKIQGFKAIHELGSLLGFKIPVDGLCTALMGRPIIDILALDKLLIDKYDYEHIGSLADFIRLGWGQRAHDILDQNI